MRRILIALPLFALAACSSASYKSETEKFINDDTGLEELAGGDVTDAACEDPPSEDVGTEYTCTATAADGSELTFDIQIDKKDHFLVALR